MEWLRDKLRETTIIKERLERDRLILIQKVSQCNYLNYGLGVNVGNPL